MQKISASMSSMDSSRIRSQLTDRPEKMIVVRDLNDMSYQDLQRYIWRFPSAAVHSRSQFGLAPNLECRIPANTNRPQVLKSPLFIRQIPWNSLSKESGVALCSAAKQLGAAISVPLPIMESLPAAAIPLRLTQVWSDRSPSLAELEMSDIIELSFCSEKAHQAEISKQCPKASDIIAWPIDIHDATRLKSRIEMIREVTEYRVPIGIALAASEVEEDVSLAVASGVDFITLTWSPNFFDDTSQVFPTVSLASALEKGRGILSEHARRTNVTDIKLVIDSPLTSVNDFAKLFALGASAWCGQSAIEALLMQSPVVQPSLGYSSMLSTHAAQTRGPSLQTQIIEKLQRYLSSLEYVLARSAKGRINELSREDLIDQSALKDISN